MYHLKSILLFFFYETAILNPSNQIRSWIKRVKREPLASHKPQISNSFKYFAFFFFHELKVYVYAMYLCVPPLLFWKPIWVNAPKQMWLLINSLKIFVNHPASTWHINWQMREAPAAAHQAGIAMICLVKRSCNEEKLNISKTQE